MAKQLMLYKLIILYMLEQVDFPMTTSQITEFILTEGYTDYFKIQQTLSELTEENLVRTENTYNRTYYHLTEEGFDTLQLLGDSISSAIRQDIDEYLKDKQSELKNEVSIKADFFPNQNNEYSIDLKVLEQGYPLIQLRLTAPSKHVAETISHNWRKKNAELYGMIMENLLS